MRVVVTGGAGFIGVVQRTDRVLNVDKLTYAANLSSRAKMACKASYQFAQADIADEARIADLLKDFELEAIIHLAAETHVDRSIESARAFIQTTWSAHQSCWILRGSIGVTYHPVDRRGSFRDGIY